MINAKEHWTQPLQEPMGVVLDGEKGRDENLQPAPDLNRCATNERRCSQADHRRIVYTRM
jgi:hypothetical protein